MRYEVGMEVKLLRDLEKYKTGDVLEIVKIFRAEPELREDGRYENPLFYVGTKHEDNLVWGESGMHPSEVELVNTSKLVPEIGRFYEAVCGAQKYLYVIRLDEISPSRMLLSNLWKEPGAQIATTGKGGFDRITRELTPKEVNEHFPGAWQGPGVYKVIDKDFINSQSKTAENVRTDTTSREVCSSPKTQRERERCSTDSIQSRRSKFKLTSSSFTNSQGAVKSRSKGNRIKIGFSS